MDHLPSSTRNLLTCLALLTAIHVAVISADSSREGISACKDGEFQCKNGQKCVKARDTCDGYRDCEDGSDDTEELCGANCSSIPSSGVELFICANGQCTFGWNKCTGYQEEDGGCNDGSDETTKVCGSACENVTGPGGAPGWGFACTNRQCVKGPFTYDVLFYL